MKLAAKTLIICFLLIIYNNCKASDLKILSVLYQNEQLITLKLSWENSFYDASTDRKDGVYLFGKIWMGSSWLPLTFEAIETSANSIGEIHLHPEKIGVLLPSKTSEKQNISIQITLSTPLTAGSILRFYGIEMVYVPEGPFFLGDSIDTQYGFRSSGSTSNPDRFLPYQVQSEAAVSIGTEHDQLFSSDTCSACPERIIPQTFPKGFASFWVMKYELSQIQYCDFLNTLSDIQQVTHLGHTLAQAKDNFALHPNAADFRNGIRCIQSSNPFHAYGAVYAMDGNSNGIWNEEEDGGSRACNFLIGSDITAYADWSGMSILTEWEFEKACRGPHLPIAGEMAWGTPHAMDANSPINNGRIDEGVMEIGNDSLGLASFNSGIQVPQLQGPLRSGFANGLGRVQRGAAWSGAEAMSGNVWEICVKSQKEGLDFKGEHGDGELDSQGNSNAFTLYEENNLILRGGGWNSFLYEVGSYRDLSISSRYFFNVSVEIRRPTTGGRLCIRW